MKEFVSYITKFGIINFFFIVLALMNLMGLGFLFGYVAIALIFFKRGILKNNLDSFFLIIILFSISYSMFYLLNPWKGMQYVVIYAMSPPFFYLWGRQLVKSANSTKSVLVMMLFLGILYSLPSLVSVILNILEGGFAQPDRNMPMFWGGPVVNATGMASFLMFNMCIPGLLIGSYKDLPKGFAIILLIIFGLSLASVLRLGSRTQIGIMVLSIVISLIFVGPKLTFKQNVVIYSILTAIVVFIFTNISFSFDSEIFTSFAGRMEDNGVEDLAGGGGRVDLWEKSIEYMFRYPFGWNLEEFGYSHNLLFDTLRVGGILSLLLLVLMFVKFITLLNRTIRQSRINLSLKLIFLLYSISFFSVFMVEPGIDGEFSMFLFFCLFMGVIVSSYYKHNLNRSKH